MIDSGNYKVIATIPLGKRPRGIHASPDQKTIYVALSGSPIAGPDVDESTLPPPDKSADGIGVFDVAQNKVVRIIKGGSDPENFDISKDGKQIYISNEDDAAVSIVDIASGTVVKSAKVGAQPEGVKVTPDGKLVCVTSEETGTISVFDPVAGKILKTFKVGHRPRNSRLFARRIKSLRQCRERRNRGAGGCREVTDDQSRYRSASRASSSRWPYCSRRMRRSCTSAPAGDTGVHDRYSHQQGPRVCGGGARPWGIALSPDARRSTRPMDPRMTFPWWISPPTP